MFPHVQGIRVACHCDSFCQQAGYSPMKVRLTDQKTIEVYEKTLQSTNIYCYAESYCRVSENYIFNFNSVPCVTRLFCVPFSAVTLSGLSR